MTRPHWKTGTGKLTLALLLAAGYAESDSCLNGGAVFAQESAAVKAATVEAAAKVLDLRTFSPGEVRLDQPVVGVFPLPGPMNTPGRVVALHDGAEGAFTVLDAADLRRETARTVRGFLLENLLFGAAR